MMANYILHLMLKNYSLIIFLKELKTTNIKCYITNKRKREREKK